MSRAVTPYLAPLKKKRAWHGYQKYQDHYIQHPQRTQPSVQQHAASQSASGPAAAKMSQTIGVTKLAYSRTWHHVSASTPHHALSTIRPIPASTSPDVTPPTLGRLASRIAILLMGKHKPIWDPSTDCGDYVVVTNCNALHTTGKKRWQKLYYRHNTRPGSLKQISMDGLMGKLGGAEVLRKAVSGMLPKNRLRDDRLARLKAFEGDAHPYMKNIVRYNGKKLIAEWPLPEEKATKTVGKPEVRS